MSLLVYSVLASGGPAGIPDPTALCGAGVEGAAVEVIERYDLGAVVSRIDASQRAPTVARALAFARVVEALHARRSVVPMRYGCLLGSPAEVVDLLREHGDRFAVLLHELDGCVEFGIRLLRELANDARGDSPAGRSGAVMDSCHAAPGSAYLVRRTAMYAEQERRTCEARAITDWVRAALDGSFLKFRTESSANLYFLIERERLPVFRAAFAVIDRALRARLLLSGPWPPYHFAALLEPVS